MLVTPHLKLWLPMEGNANDASGNGNNGTVYGATLTTGKFGQCYSFDGTDDYIDCGNDASFNITDEITIAAWIKPDSTSSGWGAIIGKSYAGDRASSTYKLVHNDADAYFIISDQTDWQQNISYGVLTAGEWTHLAAVLTSNNLTIFTNGQQNTPSTRTVTPDINTYPVLVGVWANVYYFHGLIGQPQIYNKALSQSDIKRIMLGMHPLAG